MESTPLLHLRKESEDRSKLGNLLKANIVFLTYHLSVNMRNPVLTQYLYQRYLSELVDNGTDTSSNNVTSKCLVNKSDPAYVIHVQAEEMSNNITVIFGYISTPMCIISCILLGSYSDYIGRRILFVIPLMGEGIRNALCTAVMCWDMDLRYMYIGEAITGITAGYNGVSLASYVYTADNAPPKASRTIGMAAVDFTTYFAAALSQAGTGYFIQYMGFAWPSFVTAALVFLTVFFVIVILPETVPLEKKQSPCIAPTKAIKNVFGFYFSKDFGRKRSLFWIAFIAFFITYVGNSGTGSIDYMLLLNQPFCWGPEMIGYVNMAAMLLYQFLTVGVIKLFHMCTGDEMIAILTALVRRGSDVLHGLAYTDYMIYAQTVLAALAAPLSPVLRGIVSRMAPADIQGSLFAGLTVAGVVASTTGLAIYGAVYDATVETMRGFVYFTCGGTRVLTAIILVVFYCVAPGILRQIKTEAVIINYQDERDHVVTPPQKPVVDSEVKCRI
ncbi:lysosomal proton-coupled steroid conjugate and bile acid symporter SLC46A3-like [Haliotis cracherodii]|uniref:lysosomal proton-coupled steroid conjugate and bile acid symporter SLC46A3-like n=1 Tax=Haliotis cracherodii TaxID=6455 RepID=UPI0039EACA84